MNPVNNRPEFGSPYAPHGQESVSEQTSSGPAVVALGGGHGLAATLAALRHLTHHLTAVVTVGDDGGSSGRLRQEFGVLPPGDLRMALSALCSDDRWGRQWRGVMQHRFHSEGSLDHHALGNLLIVTLWQLLDDPVAGLDWVARLLHAQGRVLPMALEPVDIQAKVRGLDPDEPMTESVVCGQVNVALTTGTVTGVDLSPAQPAACPEAVAAIMEAEWVVLGPGSWFTSVIPHLMVPEILHALCNTPAKRCLTMNLAPQDGETAGLDARDHLAAIRSHAPDFHIDVILADPSTVDDPQSLADLAATMGATLIMRQVRTDDASAALHDALRLAAAYRDLFANVVGDV